MKLCSVTFIVLNYKIDLRDEYSYNFRHKLLGRFDNELNLSTISVMASNYSFINECMSLFAGPPTTLFNVECLPNNTTEEKSVEIQH